jgi:hypothetical protein
MLGCAVDDTGDALADVTDHDGGPSGVVASPEGETEDDRACGQLQSEFAALAFVSAATSHTPVSLRMGESFVISAHISREPYTRYKHHELTVHPQCIPLRNSALSVHSAYR